MEADPTFDAMYRDEPTNAGTVPWDIGGPQPVVQELVAHGALRGEVLDPGTGPGHHAIYFASRGHPATGIDASPAAIEHARGNAERAGVTVDFRVADATRLAEFEGRFDTVVDSAFYHVFAHDEQLQARYIRALHLATAPGARLFMFALGRHNLNGLRFDGLPADNFNRILEANGWRLDHLGTSTYVGTFSPRALDVLSQLDSGDGVAPQLKTLPDQLAALQPPLENYRVHLPMWSVCASRID